MERESALEEKERKQGTRRGRRPPSPSFTGTGGLEKAPRTPALLGARWALKYQSIALYTIQYSGN